MSESATSTVTFVPSGRPRAVQLHVGIERTALDDRRCREPDAALIAGDGRSQQQVADLQAACAAQRSLEAVIDAALAPVLSTTASLIRYLPGSRSSAMVE